MAPGAQHRELLIGLATDAMHEQELLTEFSDEVREELAKLEEAARPHSHTRGQTDLLWCSIDNDDSEDLDQLSAAEELDGGRVRILVAVADVDTLVPKGNPIDEHAKQNTTSVYMPGHVFPMLPERLSTDLTSLNPDVERCAIVFDMVVDARGNLEEEQVYPALVKNRAKLAYNGVGAWLAGEGELPAAARAVDGMAETIRVQDRVAQALKERRYERGALEFASREAHAVFDGSRIVGMELRKPNRATELIENFMIAANGVAARHLTQHGMDAIQRVVRSPERWRRLVGYARSEFGARLPAHPDGPALRDFLAERRKADPQAFPDVSLAVIKLLGRGEYMVRRAGRRGEGHFGLAVQDYAHSTAPNRRYPDLITQRLLKASLTGRKSPYSERELVELADHCSEQEAIVEKVERRIAKSAAALLLERRIGEEFRAIVTGASERGAWVRITDPPVEGKLVRGEKRAHVGKRMKVELVRVDVGLGHLDFVPA